MDAGFDIKDMVVVAGDVAMGPQASVIAGALGVAKAGRTRRRTSI